MRYNDAPFISIMKNVHFNISIELERAIEDRQEHTQKLLAIISVTHTARKGIPTTRGITT